MDKYESILQQCPEGITIDMIQELYKKHNGNTTDILLECWNLDTTPSVNNKIYDDNYKKREKWNEIRDICMSYEEEMSKMMKQARQEVSQECQTIQPPTDNIIES